MYAATILPYAHMHATRDDDYHMCLAQLCRHPAYRRYFAGLSRRGGKHVIMDNGVAEMGSPLELDELCKSIKVVRPQEVILPDWIADASRTMRSISENAKALRDRFPEVGLMAVPHGLTITEWRRCVEAAIQSPEVSCIGLSKFWIPSLMPERSESFRLMPELLSCDKSLHILGVHSKVQEIRRTAKAAEGRIRSCDSAVAAIYTAARRRLNDHNPKPRIPFNPDWQLPRDLLALNILLWKELCRGQ